MNFYYKNLVQKFKEQRATSEARKGRGRVHAQSLAHKLREARRAQRRAGMQPTLCCRFCLFWGLVTPQTSLADRGRNSPLAGNTILAIVGEDKPRLLSAAYLRLNGKLAAQPVHRPVGFAQALR